MAAWRRKERAAVRGFSPVIIEPAPRAAISQEPPPQEAASGVVDVELKDVRVKISAGTPSGVIAATSKALRS